MIKVALTQNYTGFNIEGSYEDFNELYDCIFNILGYDECININEEDMRLHSLGFLYDLRHAYQGDRYVKTIDNYLTDEQKRYHGIEKGIEKNIIYSFDYLVTDLILDILIFKYFANKNHKVDEYDTNYNVVMTFYSKVVNALFEIMPHTKFSKLKQTLKDSVISKKDYSRQWFLHIDKMYIEMKKTKRKQELEQIIDYIVHYNSYDEYRNIKRVVEKFAKEHNILVTQVEYEEFPSDIRW